MKLTINSTTSMAKVVLAAAVATAIVGASFASAASAQAHWWWASHAHAQEKVSVTIQKYIDGVPATAANANNMSFPMSASWNDPGGVGTGTGAYVLAADNNPPYKAKTSQLNEGASYATNEVLTGNSVGSVCATSSAPFALVGYSVGSSLAAAKEAPISTSSPSFSNITSNKYVIVWNKSCGTATSTPTTTPATGQLTGQVSGGQSTSTPPTGTLAVTSVTPVDTTATAKGEFGSGWKYLFNITVPTNEDDLSMKFANWSDGSGHTIPVANNMRISSAQASATSTVLLTAANTYSSPVLHMTGDLDAGTPGLQVQVLVEVAIPTTTFNGNYSTSYGVKTE